MADNVIETGRSRIEDILLKAYEGQPLSRIEEILLSLYQDLVHLDDQGLIPTELIPPVVFEHCEVVTDDTARFALTTDDVQNGDLVYVNSSQIMYFVVDDTKLDVEAGYLPLAAGVAAKAIADENGNNIASTYQTIIDSVHKLNADYVDDSNSTNKFTNAADKTKLGRIIMDSTENTLLYVQATQPTGTIPEGSIWINTAVSNS